MAAHVQFGRRTCAPNREPGHRIDFKTEMVRPVHDLHWQSTHIRLSPKRWVAWRRSDLWNPGHHPRAGAPLPPASVPLNSIAMALRFPHPRRRTMPGALLRPRPDRRAPDYGLIQIRNRRMTPGISGCLTGPQSAWQYMASSDQPPTSDRASDARSDMSTALGAMPSSPCARRSRCCPVLLSSAKCSCSARPSETRRSISNGTESAS